ncbi:ATP-dependent RecD-like DNA helicase [Halorhodospira abdelmalekii]|uniref:SF1B family DNA helicase RecD2 n=1 Tax=Halorhodospira abdelmalekii TaxID=421629 RepID=UPI001904150D|nr:ATP-dependent RecD-like DNA helicase [Halorhodospira abdelmalekii]MBK1734591.1 ATP-dependent RecD-like DNA helicase [Halorhodospira abdelmalekii]
MGLSICEPQQEVLAGLIERVTFHNADSGFCVLQVKARGQRDLVTIVGHAGLIGAGEWVTASGMWTNDRNYGLQFRANFLKSSAPSSTEGIRRYLASGMIRGIGPIYGGKLVAAFGDQVFDVIEQEPERLRQIEGIGPVRAQRIKEAWAEQKVVREIMVFLHSHGVGTARAVRIYKTYGSGAVAVMVENPYRLARDIRGIGFLTADRIAAKLGIDPQAPIRVRAGVAHALAEAMDGGHCGLPRDELLRTAQELLEVPPPLIEQAVEAELDSGAIVADALDGRDCLFLAGLYQAEQGIAERLRALLTAPLPWPAIDSARALAWVEKQTGMELAKGQRQAVATALRSKVCVITGGPGVGKTTVLNSLLRILSAKRVELQLCAPTGRAAKRMSETTGLPAQTIHRLLETDSQSGGFKRNADHPIEADLVVVDETSMVDVRLMYALVKALPEHAALILVGDVDQLPSVGPGQVLADLIDAATLPVVRLTEVFRQAARSAIVTAAHRINAGQLPELEPPAEVSDFYFVPGDDPETVVERLLEIVGRRIPRRFGFDPVRDIQVLCPMNRGGLGARALNVELQAALNPQGYPKVERYGSVFAPGDKVMQTENDYDREVYNGDLGLIRIVDPEAAEVSVDFEGRTHIYSFSELDALVPAYAVTIHKAQGSEYPVVVMPITTQHYPMLQRNLIYTGVTRARALLILVGQRKALAIAVKGRGQRRRWSRLRKLLAASGTSASL